VECFHPVANADDNEGSFASNEASADGDAVSGLQPHFHFRCR
jgi:hypothetical protein